MNALKLAVRAAIILVIALIIVACGSFGNKEDTDNKGDTIGSLSKKRAIVKKDVAVTSSRSKAIKQSQELINTDSKDVNPEIKRRLGDLRMEESEDYLAEEIENLDITRLSETIKSYEDILENHQSYAGGGGGGGGDRVLYQLSHAYELNGEHEKALKALDQLVYEYPDSKYYAETQFRRAEILFVKKQYSQAEAAYESVINRGSESRFYIHSLYKHGWSHFKQANYGLALPSFNKVFIELSNASVEKEQIAQLSRPDQELIDGTLRATGLSFGYLGGAEEISKFYNDLGRKPYEILIYERLGEQCLGKRRWSDAANTYREFVETHKFSTEAPYFQIKSIEAYQKGKFPSEVLRAKKQFVADYNLKSEYWVHNDIGASENIVLLLKSAIIDLAKHYHSTAQKQRKPKDYYHEAATWYTTYLESFPQDRKASEMNFYLAEVLYETKQYKNAVLEYEKTAYEYGKHPQAAESAYAAIITYNEWLKVEKNSTNQTLIKSQLIDSNFKFSENFSEHPEAPKVMTVSAAQLYACKDYARATEAANIIIQKYPRADKKLQLSAWTVAAHSAFDTGNYVTSENAYLQALQRVYADEDLREPLKDRLAAAIYKQGEVSKKEGDLVAAVQHYFRVGKVVPDAEIRATAQYDAAAVLLELEDWDSAVITLEDFRHHYPQHELQDKATRKLAVSYDKGGQHLKAAKEYEAVADDANDPALQREARLYAAELYNKGGDTIGVERSLITYIEKHPQPVEPAMEAMHKLVTMYAERNYLDDKLDWQGRIIDADAKAGAERNDRTKFLAANAALELARPKYDAFKQIFLIHPLKKNLQRKKKQMQLALNAYEAASSYKVEQVTTAATFWTARIYQDFSKSLMESDRPPNLSTEELEQYDILLEEQAYPFEEQAIETYELNIMRISDGVYDAWVKKSLAELGNLVPAQYVKAERSENLVQNIY